MRDSSRNLRSPLTDVASPRTSLVQPRTNTITHEHNHARTQSRTNTITHEHRHAQTIVLLLKVYMKWKLSLSYLKPCIRIRYFFMGINRTHFSQTILLIFNSLKLIAPLKKHRRCVGCWWYSRMFLHFTNNEK